MFTDKNMEQEKENTEKVRNDFSIYFTPFNIYYEVKRRFLYSENYIKIIYYITLINNE
jgi:hypothetical protein